MFTPLGFPKTHLLQAYLKVFLYDMQGLVFWDVKQCGLIFIHIQAHTASQPTSPTLRVFSYFIPSSVRICSCFPNKWAKQQHHVAKTTFLRYTKLLSYRRDTRRFKNKFVAGKRCVMVRHSNQSFPHQTTNVKKKKKCNLGQTGNV